MMRPAEPRPHDRLRKVALGIAGLAFGATLLVLALRGVDRQEALRVLREIDAAWVVAAWVAYAAGIAVRILRWRHLLLAISPGVSAGCVAETLLAGYAVNNLLPARLGELFRADYAKHRLAVPRAGAFGSIVAERLLDGVIIVSLLWAGLVIARVGSSQETLMTVAVTATALILLLVAAILASTALERSRLRLPPWLAGRFSQLVTGMTSLQHCSRLTLATASVAIWLCETVALWMVCRATGLTLTPGQSMTLMGAASLSTLVPTAPAFLGSYQYVFVVVMGAYGLAESAGIVAATTIQVVCYGSVTVAGLGLMLLRAARGLRAAA